MSSSRGNKENLAVAVELRGLAADVSHHRPGLARAILRRVEILEASASHPGAEEAPPSSRPAPMSCVRRSAPSSSSRR